ncbi:hypothetical protein E2C01_010218 [Portunus trituberculatus]|uniref:Uncharacterized protein n=1 Tax=Portunus trituberculatus TaxID=210409 RepID=A0A5B7D817_PORTR|nr:hypothetical protein [Portunus trituberculatus]
MALCPEMRRVIYTGSKLNETQMSAEGKTSYLFAMFSHSVRNRRSAAVVSEDHPGCGSELSSPHLSLRPDSRSSQHWRKSRLLPHPTATRSCGGSGGCGTWRTHIELEDLLGDSVLLRVFAVTPRAGVLVLALRPTPSILLAAILLVLLLRVQDATPLPLETLVHHAGPFTPWDLDSLVDLYLDGLIWLALSHATAQRIFLRSLPFPPMLVPSFSSECRGDCWVAGGGGAPCGTESLWSLVEDDRRLLPQWAPPRRPDGPQQGERLYPLSLVGHSLVPEPPESWFLSESLSLSPSYDRSGSGSQYLVVMAGKSVSRSKLSSSTERLTLSMMSSMHWRTSISTKAGGVLHRTSCRAPRSSSSFSLMLRYRGHRWGGMMLVSRDFFSTLRSSSCLNHFLTAAISQCTVSSPREWSMVLWKAASPSSEASSSVGITRRVRQVLDGEGAQGDADPVASHLLPLFLFTVHVNINAATHLEIVRLLCPIGDALMLWAEYPLVLHELAAGTTGTHEVIGGLARLVAAAHRGAALQAS